MLYIQLFFKDRDKPFCIPVADSTVSNVLDLTTTHRSLLGLQSLESLYGQPVLVNTDHVQYVQSLLEVRLPVISPDKIKPSPYSALDDPESVVESDGHFKASFWFSGRSPQLDPGPITLNDWDDISRSIVMPDQAFSFTDSVGEKVIVRTSELDIVIATEVGRYTSEQLDLHASDITEWTP